MKSYGCFRIRRDSPPQRLGFNWLIAIAQIPIESAPFILVGLVIAEPKLLTHSRRRIAYHFDELAKLLRGYAEMLVPVFEFLG